MSHNEKSHNEKSHNDNFKDNTSLRHLFAALTVLILAPLLPTLMGWFTVLS